MSWQNGPSSNNEVPHLLMDCGQGKSNNIVNNDPATGRSLDEVGGDVASGQECGQVGRVSNGEEDATGNDSVEDVPIAIASVNYPIAGVPHPINKWFDSTNVSRYRHLTVQPHLRVVKGWSSGGQYHNRHLTVQPHLWVV